MSLKDLKLPQAVVEIPGGSFAVRGLSPAEIEHLVREHRATLGALFDQFKTQAGSEDDMIEAGAGLLMEAPELMARIIALAADEPDAVEFALKLPTAVQLAALGKIAGLTFSVEGDLGKLLATVVEKVGGINGVLEAVAQVMSKLTKN